MSCVQSGESAGLSSSRLWEAQESTRVPIEGYGLALGLSRGGRYLALGGMVPGQHGYIALYDGAGKLNWKHKTREAISTVGICRSGDYLATASDDNNIYFFGRSGLLEFKHEVGRLVKCLALSENGDFMVAGGEDSNLYFFDRKRQIKKFAWKYRFEDRVVSAAISADGRVTVAGSADRTAAYLDATGQLLWAHEARDSMDAVAISSDGGVVALGSSDHKVYLFSGTGIPLATHDCGAPVSALAMSSRGDCVVAAAGRELICLDAQGVRLWSCSLGTNIVKMVASGSADCVLASTGDNVVHFVTRPGFVGWRYSAKGAVYAIAISDDAGLAAFCGPMELVIFDLAQVARELISRHQSAVTVAKKGGHDVSVLEASLRQATAGMGARNYPSTMEALSEVRNGLEALERIALEREKLRRDTADALSKMILSIDELKAGVEGRGTAGTGVLEGPEPRIAELDGLAEKAEASFQSGMFTEALSYIRQAEELVQLIRQERTARAETRKELEAVAERIQEAAKLDIDVSEAKSHLEAARGSLKLGNFREAAELGRKALASLTEARARSPRAMEAELERALGILSSPGVTEVGLAEAQAALELAAPLIIERREFLILADSYERLAQAWAKRPRGPSTAAAYEKAMRTAMVAYIDAGKPDRAVAIAKQLEDWVTAAKLLTRMGDRNRAGEAWTRAATAKKPKPLVPDELKSRVEGYMAQSRFLDAAEELARAGFLLEASRVLRREKPEARAVALMLRLLFQLQDFETMLEMCREYLPALRREARDTGDSKDLAVYAQVLVGALEVAKLLNSPEEAVLARELDELVQDYTRAIARDELSANELCDRIVLYHHLTERNWKAAERLAELKGGEFWDHIKGALGAWRDVNVYLFREEIHGIARPAAACRHMTQPLPEVVSTGGVHEALSEMAPFNLPLLIFQLLDQYSNREYLGALVRRGDASLAAGRENEAINCYQKALACDTFGLLDTRRINLRLAGIYLQRGGEQEAAPHLEAARAGREAALAEYRAVRGIRAEPPPAPKAAGAAAPSRPSRATCPRCGNQIPVTAIRCFKCGATVK
ncbi:MAG: PQQ-binding-like beta-propeller repeat protein [Thermoplasmata archaeon]